MDSQFWFQYDLKKGVKCLKNKQNIAQAFDCLLWLIS